MAAPLEEASKANAVGFNQVSFLSDAFSLDLEAPNPANVISTSLEADVSLLAEARAAADLDDLAMVETNHAALKDLFLLEGHAQFQPALAELTNAMHYRNPQDDRTDMLEFLRPP